jgi:hypothetical protein
MSTSFDHWDRRYTDRVRLLVDILPVLGQDLFEHDLPRLSVDIDLAWLPVHDYAEDARLIAEALERLADAAVRSVRRIYMAALQVNLSMPHRLSIWR